MKRKPPYSTLWCVETWDGFACKWKVENLDHIDFTKSSATRIKNKLETIFPTRVVRYSRDSK